MVERWTQACTEPLPNDNARTQGSTSFHRVGRKHPRRTSFDPRVRELVVLITAQTVVAEYAQVQHEPIAAPAEVVDEQINAVKRGALNVEFFTDQKALP